MATTYCPTCGVQAVRHAQDICSICRAKGFVSLKSVKVDTSDLMGQLEPRVLIEDQLRQLRIMQMRVQKVIDGEDKSFRGDVVAELGKITRSLTMGIKEWRQLEKHAREAAEQMSEDEMTSLLVDWFQQRSKSTQRDLLQQLTREYNEGKTGNGSGT